ncbi:hypothetical protein CNMCM8927_005472 [Aspergillus lentulus]|uniref:Rhodopsin domain-containing protein n=1 Tax=Aspergillus lentulus TaxID=293939 RepID=A0AAN6BQE6_ASPLE|nr:hypothetical protein CNMCM6069_004722 [Aspergillus lentulus]KAF4178169.1 hypothetical protein CNMCM8060_004752 [Aspergillus lentulus]KAF4183735.1 hypothetical protein CNMCM7927_008862 [Aspergillus lentulus]KAF4195472.1 hypothetical protein CNMCM8694_006275 [Aspergillus lentulus]KAF4206066.1 hypothetical protein CNMCM8927_005472 [Aspergillus lentulus]
MRPGYLFIIAGSLLGHAAQSKELNYADSIHALAYGNVAASSVDSRGDVWLNITGFAVNELPYIQEAVGITSLDNARELQVIAGLTGPLAGPDDRLIELYASTSSSPSLVKAFRALPDQYAKSQVKVGLSTVAATEPSATAVAKREVNIDRNRVGNYIFSHFYNAAIATTKLVVLALYYRIFVTFTFGIVVLTTAAFVILWLVTMEIVLGLPCRPIAQFWDPKVLGQCFDLVAFTNITNITNLISDIWIFVLHLPNVLRLHMPCNRKIALGLLFAIGLATCGISAGRLSVVVVQGSCDFTCAGVRLGILSAWEPLGGIFCASLPIIYRPVVTTFSEPQRLCFWTAVSHAQPRFAGAMPPTVAPLCNRNSPKMSYHLEFADNTTCEELSVPADESQYHPRGRVLRAAG